MNELHLNSLGINQWEIQIRKSTVIDVAYGIPFGITAQSDLVATVLPAIQQITRHPLIEPNTGEFIAGQHPLYIPTESRRCWLIIASANRSRQRGFTDRAIQDITTRIAQAPDEMVIHAFRTLYNVPAFAHEDSEEITDVLDQIIDQQAMG